MADKNDVEVRTDEVSDDELAGLGPEERKALMDDAGGEGEGDPDDDGAGDGEGEGEGDDTGAGNGNGDGEGDDNPDGEGDEGNPEGEDDAAAAAAAAEGDGKGEAPKPDLREFQAELAVNPVENYDQKMADISTKRNELATKLKNGDIELEDYLVQDRELQTEETDLRIQQKTAENNALQNRKMAEQRWEWQQEQFFAQNKIYDDPILGAALDRAVRDLANDPANASRSGMWFLNEADRLVRERFNLPADGGNKGGDGKDKGKGKGGERKPDLSNLPPNIGNLPAAESSETGADEFSYLDKLSGMELESALARLTPEQTERYLTR
jgi:hypothetical protein